MWLVNDKVKWNGIKLKLLEVKIVNFKEYKSDGNIQKVLPGMHSIDPYGLDLGFCIYTTKDLSNILEHKSFSEINIKKRSLKP